MKIGIIASGISNLYSVQSAIEFCGYDWVRVEDRSQLNSIDKLIIPGVGTFGELVDHLQKSGLFDAIDQKVVVEKMPIFGICLGMQIMATEGQESAGKKGFGWFEGVVRKIKPKPGYKVPHIGWNDISIRHADNSIWTGVDQGTSFYFVHSYFMDCLNSKDVAATCYHGEEIVAAVARDNIFATQFHPEKSSALGLKLLKNFLDLQYKKC